MTEEIRQKIENALQLAWHLMPEDNLDKGEWKELKEALELVKNLSLSSVSISEA